MEVAKRPLVRLVAGLLLGLALSVLGGCRGPADPADYPSVVTLGRELAVAERVAPAGATVPLRCGLVAQRQGALFIPYGGRLTLYAELPPKAVLRLGSLARCGAGSGRLRVVVTTDFWGVTRSELDATDSAQAARLPPAGGPARLELVAQWEATEARSGGLSAQPSGGLLLGELSLGARPSAAVPSAVAASPGRRGGRPPDVLIWLVDALRRDGLGCYGGRRSVSPHLDRLAAEGTVFGDAVAQGSWTRPAVASLLTGLTPAGHGVYTTEDALGEQAVTLGERLQRTGYRTIGLVGNINVGGKMGFRQGFDTMRQLLIPRDAATEISGVFRRWLDASPDDRRPYFAYLHTIEPHSPYTPPEPFRTRFASGVPLELGTRKQLRRLEQRATPVTHRTVPQLRALYDAEVATNDAAFGELRAWLERRGSWNDTVVIVLSDHGEEFFEHRGWEHGMKMHQETMGIPLIVRVPGLGGGRRVERLVQQVDLLPTVLELAGVPVPPGLDGKSLLPSIAGTPEGPAPPARAYQRFLDGAKESSVTIHRFRLLVRTQTDGKTAVRLYDRRRDPHERRDVAAKLPITTAYLRSVLRWPAGEQGRLVRPAGRLGNEVQKQLRALGYVN